MSDTCEIVQDLLPLYQDEVCSPASRTLVENHLRECPDCARMLEHMRSSVIPDEKLKQEANRILERQEKTFRRRSFTAGAIVAGILSVPILVCLIVNLADGHGLSWFFIVLSALMVAASVTVLPLMVPRNRGFWTAIGAVGSLLFLLAVCCVYTRGDWFFIPAAAILLAASLILLPFLLHSRAFDPSGRGFIKQNKGLVCALSDTLFLFLLLAVCCLYTHGNWFLIPVCAILLGESVLVLPFVLRSQVFRTCCIGRHKALFCLLAATVSLAVLFLVVGAVSGNRETTPIAFAVALPFVIYAWGMLGSIRYLPGGALIRTGTALSWTSVFLFFADWLIGLGIGYDQPLPVFDPMHWNFETLDGNLKWILLIVGLGIGLILLLCGILTHRETNKTS